MPRLIDRFRSGPLAISYISGFSREKHAEWVGWMREDIEEGAAVVVIDNVADYCLEHEKSFQRWELADIPNGAPPWPLAWYEFKVPGDPHPGVPDELGWWVQAQDREEGGWELHCSAWGGFRGEKDVTGPMGGHRVDVASDGTVERITPIGEWPDDKLPYATMPLLVPVLMANSFAHCRNVQEEVVRPPEKLSKAYKRRHGVPLMRYSVLVIDPMREVLRSEGRSEKVGQLRALHICRGHFKTFDEKPLFGRLQGTYFWPAHVRGKAEAGEVRKAYRVRALGSGAVEVEATDSQPKARYPDSARAREIELFAVDKALAYLRIRYPETEVEVMPHSNPGYDLRVGHTDDPIRYVEVKGTAAEAPTFFMSENERQFSVREAERYTLLLVGDIDTREESFELHVHEGAIDERFALAPVQWRGSFIDYPRGRS